ncbi:MAG: hypothetical protein Q4A29_03375 [Eubacteriales bacterium]|nr:hypothetical protein [Eubacteriales bacterium]
MRFIEINTIFQVLLSIFYIIAIILEVASIIIAFINKSGKKVVLFFIGLIIVSSIQMFMMIEILYEKEWNIGITDFTLFSSRQNVILTILFLTAVLLVSGRYIKRNYDKYKKEISFNSIKEAFDNLPKAISIINSKGIPVLVNKQMYDFVFQVTGRDFQCLEDIQDILNRDMQRDMITLPDSTEDEIILRLKDNSVWQVEQKEFQFEGAHFQEISAHEITQIYQLSNQLQEKNHNLTEQKKKQEKLLKDLIQSRKEEEILNLKIDTHAKFGKAILATQLFLENQNEVSPIEIWQEVIEEKEWPNIEGREHSLKSSNPFIDASQVFGCNIILEGELPKEEKISYLVLSAMREAITNAVRHSQAEEVRIRITEQDSVLKVEVEDDSDLKIASIKETGGLADLRKKIEKFGGKMEILCQNCVKMKIELPLLKGN